MLKLFKGLVKTPEAPSFRGVIEQSSDAVVELNPLGSVIFFNKASEHLWGYSNQEIFGQSVTALFEGVNEGSTQNLLDGWKDSLREIAIRRKDGRALHGSMSLSKITVGNDYFYSMTVRDATEIQEERERYAQILGQAVDAIVSIDEHNCVTFFNAAAERLFGYSREEALGQNVKMLVPEDIRPNHDKYINANRTTGVNKIVGKTREVEITRKDGTKTWGQLSVSKIYLGDKMIYTGFMRDINQDHLARANTNTAIEKVLNSGDQISQIATAINDMAAEMKLLSLNISIEAANAGDSARGIAVLAAEFEKLSQDSNRSASQIQKLINETKIHINNLEKSFQQLK